MFNNKYILIAALVLAIPMVIAWTFNHINPWVGFGVFFIIVLLINQSLKPKQKK